MESCSTEPARKTNKNQHRTKGKGTNSPRKNVTQFDGAYKTQAIETADPLLNRAAKRPPVTANGQRYPRTRHTPQNRTQNRTPLTKTHFRPNTKAYVNRGDVQGAPRARHQQGHDARRPHTDAVVVGNRRTRNVNTRSPSDGSAPCRRFAGPTATRTQHRETLASQHCARLGHTRRRFGGD